MTKQKSKVEPETNGSSDIEESQLANLRKMAPSLDVLQKFLADMGARAVAEGTATKRESRKARVESAMAVQPLSPEDQELLVEFANAAFDQEIEVDPEKGLTQAQIDDLIGTLAMVRPVQDLAKGRHDGIRQMFFEHFDITNGPLTKGKAASLVHQMKVERGINEPGGSMDLDGLKDIVDEKTWKAISRSVPAHREADPQKVAEAFDAGKITREQLEQITTVGQPVQKFYVKPLSKGEEF